MRKRIAFRILAVLVSVGVALGAAELLLRLLGDRSTEARADAGRARRGSIWTASDDPVLVYRHRRRYRDLTDRFGLLHVPGAAEVTVEKRAGRFRVAVLGDSIAAGLDLAQAGARFPDRLAALLPAEVLNFAVNGYRTVQEARVLETSVARFQPDLVVLQYCMNDPGNSLTPTVWFQKRKDSGSRLVRLAQSIRDPKDSDWVPVFGPDYGKVDYWLRLYEPGSKSWRSVEESFQRVAAQKIPCVVVVFPLLLDGGWQEERMRPYHDQVRSAAEAAGLAFLDLFDRYREHDVADLQMSAGDIYHPNAKGHAIAAEAIAEWVASYRQASPAD